MELSPPEQQNLSYAQSFQWPDTDEWEEERNVLLNDFKTHVNEMNDLETQALDTPINQRRIPTLTSNDKAVSPGQPHQHQKNKPFDESLFSFCCAGRSKDLNKRENRFF